MQKLGIKGKVRVTQGDKVLAEGSNRVVTTGLELLARLILGLGTARPPAEFRLGTSSSATTAGMSGIQGRTLLTLPVTPIVEGRNLIWEGEYVIEEAIPDAVAEIAIFTPNENIMLSRFIPIPAFILNKDAPLRIHWEIQIGD